MSNSCEVSGVFRIRVYIEGRLRPDPETGGPRWYKRQDETVGASYELVADVVRFFREIGVAPEGIYLPELSQPVIRKKKGAGL